MNKESKKIIKEYKKEVKKHLNYGWAMKSVLSKELDDYISTFVEEKESITNEELYSDYGEPKDVAESLFTKKDYSEQLRKAKRKIFWLNVIVVLAIIVLIFAVTFINHLLTTYGGYTQVSNPELF